VYFKPTEDLAAARVSSSSSDRTPAAAGEVMYGGGLVRRYYDTAVIRVR
jgi:hypothetical protein